MTEVYQKTWFSSASSNAAGLSAIYQKCPSKVSCFAVMVDAMIWSSVLNFQKLIFLRIDLDLDFDF